MTWPHSTDQKWEVHRTPSSPFLKSKQTIMIYCIPFLLSSLSFLIGVNLVLEDSDMYSTVSSSEGQNIFIVVEYTDAAKEFR